MPLRLRIIGVHLAKVPESYGPKCADRIGVPGLPLGEVLPTRVRTPPSVGNLLADSD
jgi:hypothetical protein